MTALSELLKKSNTQALTTREISTRADLMGHPVTHVTVSRYMRGKHPVPPKQEILEAFAAALNIPIRELEEAAGAPPTQVEPFNLPAKANALNQSEREAILQLIDVMVEAKTPPPAKPWQKNLPTPDDMAYHIGAPTPTGGEFRPDKYQDDRLIWDRHGKSWFKHYAKAAKIEEPGDDIEEPYTD